MEEELKRLKNLKAQELMKRLKEIETVAGLQNNQDENSNIKIDQNILDEDWDPEKHEAMMMVIEMLLYYQLSVFLLYLNNFHVLKYIFYGKKSL